MDLQAKIRTIPTEPGVYLYKNAEGEVIYVGKAKNLRSRVASYFHEGRWEDAKTGTLVREAVDVDYIVVANNKEALALENNLIKQRKPRFNILLRDDKTYPYVKLTLGERWPRVYVTRRLRKDGSAYYGPYFPANLAYRIVDLIHRNFLIPSCKVDLTRFHPRPCLQYYIKRCLGPCVKDLTTPETYQEAVRDVKMFLEGRPTDLARSLRARMEQAAAAQEYERAARYRDLISTVEQLQERQRIAAAEGDDADVFGYHYENGMLAVNLFHMRGGKMVDRREFFWEDLPEFAVLHEHAGNSHVICGDSRPRLSGRAKLASAAADAADLLEATSAEMHAAPTDDAGHRQHGSFIPANSSLPCSSSSTSASPTFRAISTCPSISKIAKNSKTCSPSKTPGARAARVHILVPQRGDKRSLIDLAGNNAKQSYDQRFRVLKPNARKIQEELQEVAQPARTAEAHRVLRHLPHPGRGDRRLDGGVGRRQDEEVGLPQVHHPHRRRGRRLRFDARSGHAALQATAGRKEADAEPGADRRRTRTTARRRRGARIARDHQPAAGRDRQARRDSLRLRTGEGSDRARSSLAGAAPDSDDPRRGAPLCRDLPPQAPADARPLDGIAGDSRRGREHDAAIAGTLRQRAGGEAGGRGGAVGRRDARAGRGHSQSLSQVNRAAIRFLSKT